MEGKFFKKSAGREKKGTGKRDGSYDIYSAVSEEGKLISESTVVTVARSPVLSSSADDKCPYITGNVMVFASDREGGFGGFDLWYSVYGSQGLVGSRQYGR